MYGKGKMPPAGDGSEKHREGNSDIKRRNRETQMKEQRHPG